MHKTARLFLTGAMILTMISACGKGNAQKPETGSPADTGVTTAEGVSTTPSAEFHTAGGQAEGDRVFDRTKVPPLTKPQKYIRDNRDYGKVSFVLARDPDLGDPTVFVGIDLTGSADLHINENDDYFDGILWETTDKSIVNLRRSDSTLEFKIANDEIFRAGGNVSLSFGSDDIYEGTPEAITTLDEYDVLLQDGNYVVYYKNNHYCLEYIYRFSEDTTHGTHRYSSLNVTLIDSLEEAPAVIARCREVFTFGYFPNWDEKNAPIGENGEEIDLLEYRDFRDIEMKALNQYGLYLDDASYLNNQADICIVDEHVNYYFTGSVLVNDYADAREVHGKVQFAGNTWYVERKDGYVHLWTPLNATEFLTLTVYSYLDTKDANELSDKELEEMLTTVFSPDKPFRVD